MLSVINPRPGGGKSNSVRLMIQQTRMPGRAVPQRNWNSYVNRPVNDPSEAGHCS